MTALISFLGLFIHIPGIVIACILHGYSRAAVSSALGDTNPKRLGRLTLNPLKHLEPIGFLCMFFFGLGWARPVETKPFGYKNRRKSEIIVAVLPLTVNLLGAAIFSAASHVMAASIPYDILFWGGWTRLAYNMLTAGAYFNLTFVIFHLIPIYPLDGAQILNLINPRWAGKIMYNQPIAQTALMLLLCFGILGALIGPLADTLLSFIYA